MAKIAVTSRTLFPLPPPRLLLFPLLVLALAVAPAGATVPSDLCTGNPCNVTGAKSIDPDSVLDFPAGTSLVFKSGSVTTLTSAGGPRSLTIRADSITFEPTARLVARPIPDGPLAWGPANVSLEALNGNLVMQASGSSTSKIEEEGNWAGDLSLSASGNVTVDGLLMTNGSGSDAFGGDVEIVADGAIAVSTDLDSTASGDLGWGGAISIDAGGSVTMSGSIDASGGGFGGGDIALDSATADVTAAGRVESSAGADGAAGSIDVAAPSGSVSFGDKVVGNGSEALDSCGDGASVTINAAGTVSFADDVTVHGGSLCTGGAISITTGDDFVQPAGVDVDASASGEGSAGGSFTLFTINSATLRAINLNGSDGGGALSVNASSALHIDGSITAKATSSEGVGGSAALGACTLVVAATGSLDVRGDGDDFGIDLAASGPMTVAGTLRSDYQINLRYRSLVPTTAGATIVVTPSVVLDPTLPDCLASVDCGDGVLGPTEACDDGNNSSCDGCAPNCSRPDNVCGDGIRECGEQCDDGNTTSGDSCNADCTLPGNPELLVQGSSQNAGCEAEWKLHIANGIIDPATGLARRTQKCTDNDPACDSDGLNDLKCTYDAQLCLRVQDDRLPTCLPAALDFLRISTPSPFSSDPISAQNGQRVLDAVEPFGLPIYVGSTLVQPGVPFSGTDACTSHFDLVVKRPNTGSGKKSFTVVAEDVAGVRMNSNQIALTCTSNSAVCGNGVIETFEQCDDGGTAACDGCSPGCHVESCGNGTLDCNEQCDDGADNGSGTTRCSTSCTEVPPVLRIPGGGSRSLDCAYEWSMEHASPPVDKKGLPKNQLTCTDGDTACDFDPTPGRCGMRIWACLGAADARLACSAAQVTLAEVTSPRSNALGDQLAARNAVVAALASLGLPAGPGEECTGRIGISLATGGKLRLATRATLASGKRDTDTLKLTCLPSH